MFAVVVTIGTVSSVFGVSRTARTARILYADTVETLVKTGQANATVDATDTHCYLFNGQNIVGSVKLETCQEF